MYSAMLLFVLMVLGWTWLDADDALAESPRCLVLVTLDGLRGEEVFGGADRRLMVKENGVEKPEELQAQYWREDRLRRRETLLPFLWRQVRDGQAWIAGDVEEDSLVRVTNGLYFSYPGYNEILTGYADPAVNSNDKKYNENVTVLEWLHRKPGFHGRVAAYTSWDVFPYIINDRRSGIPVNAGWQPLEVGNPHRLQGLNFVAAQLFHQFEGVRYDAFTLSGAIEEMKTNQPRLLYVSLGETDDWAHAGRYDRYLLTAQQNDYFIQQLWDTVQTLSEYRNQTLFLITTDHGRGDGREGWKNHGVDLPGSERIWMAALGDGLQRHGIDAGGRYEQAQIAATVAAYLGYDFQSFRQEVKPPLPILK